MTRATIQVEVPRPCAEAYEAMTPTAQGRFCAACQHTVTDFSHRTDAEVLALLRQAAGRRVCGRFRADQLQRPLLPPPAPARWRAWLLAAATLWGLRSLTPETAAAQTLQVQSPGPPVPRDAAHTLPPPDAAVAAPDAAATRRISGKVLMAYPHEPLPGVTVLVKNTQLGVSTGADGTFVLEVPTDAQVLQVSSIGFVTREVSLSPTEQVLQVELDIDTRPLTGELVVTRTYPWYAPRTWWNRLRYLPQRLGEARQQRREARTN